MQPFMPFRPVFDLDLLSDLDAPFEYPPAPRPVPHSTWDNYLARSWALAGDSFPPDWDGLDWDEPVRLLESWYLEDLQSPWQFPLHSPWQFPSNPNPNKCKREREVYGSLNELPVRAFPDTGSDRDFISAEFARKHEIRVNTTERPSIRLPHGLPIHAVGTVSLSFSLAGETATYDRVFTVLERSIHDVILGGSFLKETQTLTRFAHRIKEKLVSVASYLPRICLTGNHRERIVGYVNGVPTIALADTGSDVMIVSFREARRLSLHIIDDDEHRTFLEFADGSIHRTRGMTKDSRSFTYDLHVVDNISCDLILSGDFLFDTEAYQKISECFVEMDEGFCEFDTEPHLSLIKERRMWKSLRSKLCSFFTSGSLQNTDVEATDPTSQWNSAYDEELRRQGNFFGCSRRSTRAGTECGLERRAIAAAEMAT
ncbi:hypothetical protein K402DRAFT_451456 [Aulographum hederae CBS 113979]|uniref:Uncharacterized protein n=1 Tax=Aulographum hederae CBS 113979 TaxID=1176131 RepID=A0A6G1HBS4_9PEZI|nr:hypothetical protein K402DRAFT_451456 [Aulographum hederae CBS 113979]